MAEDSHTVTSQRARKAPLTKEQRQQKQTLFLQEFAECGNVKYCCQVAGISRKTFYQWKEHDKNFAASLMDVEPDVTDTLEYAAYERAVKGVPSYVVSQGKLIYGSDGNPLTEYRYSDALLQTLLKARLPEKYKDKSSVEHSGSIDVSRAKETLLAKLVPEKDGETA